MVGLIGRIGENRRMKSEIFQKEKKEIDYMESLSQKADFIFNYLGEDLVEPVDDFWYEGSGGDFADPSSTSSKYVKKIKKRKFSQGSLEFKYFLHEETKEGKNEKGLIISSILEDEPLLVFDMKSVGSWGKIGKKIKLNKNGTWEETFESLYSLAEKEKEKFDYKEKIKREEERIFKLEEDKKNENFSVASRAYLEFQ
jgi:hypothetical protein